MFEVKVVFVVDDEKCNRYIFKKLLNTFYPKVRVFECNGWVQLSQNLSTVIPDLLIMDIMMPDVDGIECVQRIKATPEYIHVPILWASTINDVGIRVECEKVGKWLDKPVDFEKFQSVVGKLLGG